MCGLLLMTLVTEKKSLMAFCFPEGLPEAGVAVVTIEREQSFSVSTVRNKVT